MSSLLALDEVDRAIGDFFVGVCTENLSSGVVVVKSAKNGV
jgi:hypothetical protein